MPLRGFAIAACLLAALLCCAPLQAADRATRQKEFDDTIRPFLRTHCFKCHGAEKQEADLRLDDFVLAADIAESGRKTWSKVRNMLELGEMPPAKEKQPAAETRLKLVGWIDDVLEEIDCAPAVSNPGRVTIRRLNRFEYRNSVRDLLGVDFQPAADFPGDDVGYGFDHIGDVLTLPPVLMEKYLAAAETIAGQAIVTQGLTQPLDRQVNGVDFEGGNRNGVFARGLTSEGKLSAKFTFPLDGEYRVIVVARGDQAGPEPVKIALDVDGKEFAKADVKSDGTPPDTIELKVTVKAGERTIAVAFLNDFYDPNAEKREDRDRNFYLDSLKIVGPIGWKPANLPESHKRIIFIEPSPTLLRRDATRQIAERFATKAFRRPVTSDELSRLTRLARVAVDRGANFEESVQFMLQGILCSPHFLFKVELDPVEPTAPEIRDLNDYELATRLAYFLWSSLPDDELLDLAKKGELRKNDNLQKQVRRMLQDSRSAALVDNFAGQWLELRRLADVQPDKSLFPAFDAKLRTAMRRETELFFGTIIREDRSVLELISADYTFLNGPLARHYGIQGVEGDEFRKVSLAGTDRGGLLTQASILTITSNPTRTSPVKRGKWVLENLLNDPPPPPPPNVPELKEGEKGALMGTLRQKMEQHRVNPGCASCHQRMDPLGFALEKYDAVGALRFKEGDSPIDDSGELPGGVKFSGSKGLRELLATQKKGNFVRCLAEKMLTYALGRGLEHYDRCAVDKLVEALEKNNYRFSALVVAIAESDPFTKRKTK